MKILVIGSGGREHALVWKLAQSPHATQMWCAPGNAGIAQERLAKNSALVECVNLGAEDLPKLLVFAQEKKADLIVVGAAGMYEPRCRRCFEPQLAHEKVEAEKKLPPDAAPAERTTKSAN